MFVIFYWNRSTLGESCNIFSRGSTPDFEKGPVSDFPYFWKLFVSWRNFQTWFIISPPPPCYLRNYWRNPKIWTPLPLSRGGYWNTYSTALIFGISCSENKFTNNWYTLLLKNFYSQVPLHWKISEGITLNIACSIDSGTLALLLPPSW